MGGTGGYQVDDSAQFSNLINELMRMNYHQVANQTGAASKGAPGRTAGEKGRANSEKQSTAQGSSLPGGKQTAGTAPQGTTCKLMRYITWV